MLTSPDTARAPWRVATGRALGGVAAVAGVLAVGYVTALDDLALLVLGDHVARPGAVLLGVLAVALPATVVARVLLRRPGRPTGYERGALLGVVVLAALAGLAVATGQWPLVVLLLALGPLTLATAPGVAAVVVLAVPVLAALTRRRRGAGRDVTATLPEPPDPRRRGLAGTTVAVVLVGGSLVSTAVVDLFDTYVVERSGTGDCTIAARETQFLFTGSATVYVGSPLATRVRTEALEESFPFRTDDHLVHFTAAGAHVRFDTGRGQVDTVVPCR